MAEKDYNEFEFETLNKNKDKLRPSRHLNRQVLCGLCKFICCKSNIFIVETTREESKKLNLPLAFPQNGACPECLPDGCRHGESRPVFCRLYPLTFDNRGLAGTSYWVTTHCPTPKHFEFVGMTPEGKYHYKKSENVKGPVKNNLQDEVFLDFPIEEFPNVLQANRPAAVELLGEERVQKLEKGLIALNEETALEERLAKPESKSSLKGFGLEVRKTKPQKQQQEQPPLPKKEKLPPAPLWPEKIVKPNFEYKEIVAGVPHPDCWESSYKNATEHNSQRVSRFGLEAELPVEFFPGYLSLRLENSRTGFYLTYKGKKFSCIAKKLRIFRAQYNRLEGLPICPDASDKEITEVVKMLFDTKVIERIRLCESEKNLLNSNGFLLKYEEEFGIANFVIDLKKRTEEIEKSRWRSQHGVNLSRRLGGIEFRLASPKDRDEIHALYESWVKWKLQDEKIMHKKVYTTIVTSVDYPKSCADLGIKTYVLRVMGVLAAATTYLVVDGRAHLLMNVSIHRTEASLPESHENLQRRIGYLTYYHVMKALHHEENCTHALLGWCDKVDKLLQFKTDMSHEQYELQIGRLP